MIVQCRQCQTRFRLDDAKVTEKGVKVRCTRCKHLFMVTREQPESEPVDSAVSGGQVSPVIQEEAFPASLLPQQDAQEPTGSFAVGNDTALCPDGTADTESPFSIDGVNSAFPPTENNDFSLSSLEEDKGFGFKPDEPPSAHGDFDFASLNFDGETDSDKTMIAPPPAVNSADKTMIQPLAAPPVTDAPTDVNRLDGAKAGQKEASLSQDSGGMSFGLGEIDFGDDPSVLSDAPVKQAELTPEVTAPPQPPVKVEAITLPPVDDALKKGAQPDEQINQDELPPLSITSRRKQSPLFTGLIAGAALLAVGIAGYFGFMSFSDDKGKVVEESGRIGLRAVKASYRNNGSAGQLLVISGEAVNQFAAPRAALQVKGVVFDAKGQILISKSAFAGNILTDEQLETFPIEKIETQMANQLGGALANLDVAPGKAIPFMIVIASSPKEGKDFGVEPTGSTAVSGKK